MPIPPPEKVSELIAGVVADAGCDLDAVTVSAAGRRSVVRVVVDSEAGLDLDGVAELTRAVSEVLDAAPGVGEAAYTLEVTTPGVDRPLTMERHWRRNRGRRVRVQLAGEPEFTARVGPVADGSVLLVTPHQREPQVRTVLLTEVTHAVVEVEFAAPDERELALSGPPRFPVAAPQRDVDEREEADSEKENQ